MQKEVIPGRVSAVIGCYNTAPEHLRAALDSALTQDYPSLEVIVVDDGSTREDTRRTLEEYSNRITVIRQENAGVAAARNAAVKLATGEFIQVFDSDDLMDSNLVSENVAVMADPEVEMVYASAHKIRSRVGCF